MPKTIVFLPTYNERENIERILQQVLAAAPDVEALVVDDNSPDGTADIVRGFAERNPRVHLLLRTEKRGRGFAQMDALRWFKVQPDCEMFIEMDADGSHPPRYIPDIQKAVRGGADVAICSRLIPGGGQRNRSVVRLLITLAANRYIRITLGLNVNDCTTGYRGFSGRAVAALDPDELFTSGPAIVQELLYVLVRGGFTVVEIPFMFEQREAGRSKLTPATLAQSISNVWKIRKVHGGKKRVASSQ